MESKYKELKERVDKLEEKLKKEEDSGDLAFFFTFLMVGSLFGVIGITVYTGNTEVALAEIKIGFSIIVCGLVLWFASIVLEVGSEINWDKRLLILFLLSGGAYAISLIVNIFAAPNNVIDPIIIEIFGVLFVLLAIEFVIEVVVYTYKEYKNKKRGNKRKGKEE